MKPFRSSSTTFVLLSSALLWAGCPEHASVSLSPADTAASQAPWLTAPSAFPDPGARGHDREFPAEPSTPSEPTEIAEPPDAGMRELPDSSLQLPPWMEVQRLPRPTAGDPEVDRRPPPGSGPVARVNGQEIGRAEYNERVQRALDAFYGLTRGLPRSTWKQVIGGTCNQLIQRTIDQQKARELNVVLTPEQIEQGFQKYVTDRGGPANFPRFLAHLHLTEADIRADVAAKLLHDAVLNRGLGELTVTDEEVVREYERRRSEYFVPLKRHLRQILIAIPDSPNPAQKVAAVLQAEEALKQIREGQDFVAVATRRSEGAARAKGGELGWLSRGQMPKEFDQVAFSMKVGTVSEIVRSPMGFHIIQCVAEQPGTQRPLNDELKQEIRQKLRQRLYQARLLDIYRSWYDQAVIEYLDPLIETEARAMALAKAKERARPAPPGH